jgi:hypothetical protein
MSRLQRLFGGRLLLTALLVVIALSIVGTAAAAYLCRADPLVILSNGVIIDFGVSISTLPMNVEEVHYELHVPVGVSMIAFVHTPTWLTSQETYTFYADQPRGQYRTSAVVHTRNGNATVVADATLIGLFGLRLDTGRTPGVVGQAQTIALST